MRTELHLATLGLADKDLLVLRSLVKLLDGRLDMRLAMTDLPERADLWFAAPAQADQLAAQPPRAAHHIVVRVTDSTGPGVAAPEAAQPWLLTRPIGVSDMTDILRSAAATIDAPVPSAGAPRGLRALFDVLRQALAAPGAAARRLRLGDGRSVLVDPHSNRVSSDVSPGSLLGGLYSIEAVTPAADGAQADAAPHVLGAQQLQWSLSHRLSSEHGGGQLVDPAKRYRLRRWPDAQALAEPGYGRLSALLTARALSVAEAAQASALPAAKVHCFVEAALACGIAAADADGAAVVTHAAPSAPPAALGLLQRLRAKLERWSL